MQVNQEKYKKMFSGLSKWSKFIIGEYSIV